MGLATQSSARTHTLPDGRTLGYAEYGDSAGVPCVFIHGTPGSHLQGGYFDATAKQHGVRIVAPERPGFGISTPHPGRTFTDTARDIASLADGLGIERFAAMGMSGGGGYVAACAHAIPERITVPIILCGMGPYMTRGMSMRNKVSFMSGRYAPFLLRMMWTKVIGMATKNPERFAKWEPRNMPESDKRLARVPEIKEVWLSDFLEAAREGPDAAVTDLRLYANDWDFRLEDIGLEVFLWHGEKDPDAPVASARHVAATIPRCRATYLPDEGHYFPTDPQRQPEFMKLIVEKAGS